MASYRATLLETVWLSRDRRVSRVHTTAYPQVAEQQARFRVCDELIAVRFKILALDLLGGAPPTPRGLDPLYVDVAVRRWQAFTGAQATLGATGRAFDEIARERLPGPARGNDAPAAREKPRGKQSEVASSAAKRQGRATAGRPRKNRPAPDTTSPQTMPDNRREP